jgi:hypothetical protein
MFRPGYGCECKSFTSVIPRRLRQHLETNPCVRLPTVCGDLVRFSNRLQAYRGTRDGTSGQGPGTPELVREGMPGTLPSQRRRLRGGASWRSTTALTKRERKASNAMASGTGIRRTAAGLGEQLPQGLLVRSDEGDLPTSSREARLVGDPHSA